MGITIERLPPERTATMPVAAAAGGCCSCCCCCFHTVGSLIGAAAVRAPAGPVGEPPVATISGGPTEPKYSVNREYWMSFLVASIITMMILAIELDGDDKLLGMFIIYAVVAPAVQLAASISALVMTLVSKRPGQSERLRHLGKITLFSVIGALLGGIVVFAMFQK
ncbi:MAG: hypothetical protein ABI175_03905 [Polyangiales bacterium]